MQDHNYFKREACNLEELVCMRSVSGDACLMQGDSAGSNSRLCLEKFVLKFFYNIPVLFLPRSSRQKSLA